jgi:3-methyladenine DNA glycosylase/8-oxoguanine DNA glycosylase
VKPAASELRALARRDPVLGGAMRRVAPFPGFPNPAAHPYRSHFHALARSIVYQQLAGSAARAIHDRVCALTPGRGFPRAPELLELSDTALRGAGLSRNKLLALRDLATRVGDASLDLRRIARKSDETIIEELVQVRGIGPWSAQMFLLFRLGRLDVMPAGDLAVREGLRRLDGLAERPAPAQVLERAEPWGPLCSVASWVLWRLSELDG